MRAFLVFTHQLFWPHPHITQEDTVWLVEDPLFFHDPVHAPAFHVQKLILHRASMRRYAERLQRAGYSVRYVEYPFLTQGRAPSQALEGLFDEMASLGYAEVRVIEPVDYLLERRLRRAARRQTQTQAIQHHRKRT